MYYRIADARCMRRGSCRVARTPRASECCDEVALPQSDLGYADINQIEERPASRNLSATYGDRTLSKWILRGGNKSTVLACSCLFRPCSGLFWPCSGMFWYVLACSGLFWPCSGLFWPCSGLFWPCSGMFWHVLALFWLVLALF